MHTENAMRAVYTILMVVIGFVILIPVLALIFGSFWSASPVAAGHVTLANWVRALTIRIPADIPTLVFNSLVFAFSTAAISVVLGVTMAFLVIRTDMPYGRVFAKLGIVPRAFPIIIAALAWILLLSPRIGVLNVMFRETFGTNLFNIYSFPGMIFLMVLYESPIVFLIAMNAFRLMDPSLEEQSIACGNTVMGTLRRVTLPVLRPLILSSFLLVFVIGLITLEVPILIGAPAGIFVFTSAIFNLIASDYQSLIYYNTAAALAMMVIPISLLSLLLYRHLVRRAESFVTVTGKARPENVHRLGHWRYVAFTCCSLYFGVVIVLPALVILLLSFSQFVASPSLDLLTQLTLRHWTSALEDVVFWRALGNTLILCVTAATATVLISLGIGYLLVRSGVKLKGSIEAATMLPLAFPGTILAVGFVWAYIKTPVYGTLWILLLYFIGNYLPFALRTLSPFLFQFHKEFEEASWTSGASGLKTIVRIVIPFLRGGLFSVWILLFQTYLREFAGAVILFTYGSEVLSTLLFQRAFDEGSFGIGAVIGVLMLVMSLGLHLLVSRREA